MFGAGCFWSPEAEFRTMPGVTATAVGFSGGHVDNPTYRMVCNKDTGHAEVILVEFDPAVVTYQHLVESFFDMHSPSYWSPGNQYRSAIFTFDDDQDETAKKVRDALREKGDRILTEITPATQFWMAEEYHQQYAEKRGRTAPSSCGALFDPAAAATAS